MSKAYRISSIFLTINKKFQTESVRLFYEK